MVKCTIGARGGLLGASLSGMADAVAVGTLGVLVGINGFVNLEALRE